MTGPEYVMFAFGHGGGCGVTLTSVGSRWLSLLRRQALDLLIASRASEVRHLPANTIVGDRTGWLRMQSEAKRSRGGISLQFRICREI